MDIDRVTLIGPNGDGCRSLSDVVVRAAAPTERSLVFEVPGGSGQRPIEERASDDTAGSNSEAGWSVVATTAEGVTYSGYVEVIADGADSRFYWCAIDR